MANVTQEWRVDQAEFQGYVKAKLEENTRAHDALFDKLDAQEKRLRDVERSATILNVRSGLVGGISAGIVLIAEWIWRAFKN